MSRNNDYGFVPIEYHRTKFYQTEKQTSRFINLSEERLLEISKRVYKMQEGLITSSLHNLDKYIKSLQYLTNPYIRGNLDTFDERVAYLIMMTDPNLIMFKEYLKLDLISLADIEKETDEEEKVRLTVQRSQTLAGYKNSVRNKIGFYDTKLLKYEELFFKRFFNERELITEIGKSNQDIIMLKAALFNNFDSISDERYKELENIANIWLSLVPEKHKYKVATYSVISQNKLLGLKNASEQLALFILLVDGNLDMLKIYEEESMMGVIKERITQEFGFYDKELLVLEKKFHDRFCPDKKLSIWSNVKKKK